MGQGSFKQDTVFSNLLILVLLFSLSSWLLASVEAYKNYTVGDSLGWYDNLLKPTINYQKWASDKSFSLGDYLIFNTDSNHSVVQTSNFTTFKLCDYINDESNGTTQWSAADPSSTTPIPISVSVPLVKEGMNYFFSGDYDGEQCKFGQNLKINVTYGQGLPGSLKTPSADSPAPTNPDFANADSAPDTLVPSNFDHPRDISDDEDNEGNEKSGTVSFLWESKICLLFFLLNFVF